MSKVYCKDCTHYQGAWHHDNGECHLYLVDDTNWKRPKNKPGDPSKLNVNNDCKGYEDGILIRLRTTLRRIFR